MKILVAGWFSHEKGHATAGDLLAAELTCDWLERAGYSYDIAVDPPFKGGINWRLTNPKDYSQVIFVCGPFSQGPLEAEFLKHFAGCRLIGLDLTMLIPLNKWNPFDVLFERDSSVCGRPDITFLSPRKLVPVVGVCLVESYEGAMDTVANAAIRQFLASQEVSIVEIDTRLDTNSTGLRTPAEVESLLARMDLVVTTRLHGTVLALKNGVPVISIDPEARGAKILRQAQTIGWPVVFTVDKLEDEALQQAFDYCLTSEARAKVRECRETAIKILEQTHDEFIVAVMKNGDLNEQTVPKFPEALLSNENFTHELVNRIAVDLHYQIPSEQMTHINIRGNVKILLKTIAQLIESCIYITRSKISRFRDFWLSNA